jgi:hypothetical protein
LLSRSVKIKIYSTIILPVFLYGCETWSLTLSEECRLGIFENRVLRRIFGSMRDEVTEELYALNSSPNITMMTKSRRMRWAEHVARMGERCTQGLCGKREKTTPFGRHRLRWENNIKMDLQEVRSGGMDWIDLAQDRDRCECGNEPSGSTKCGVFPD